MSDPKVEEIRARLDHPHVGDIDYLLTKLDEAEKAWRRSDDAGEKHANGFLEERVAETVRADAAEERERTLIAGVGEALVMIQRDIDRLANLDAAELKAILSRLLPSDQLPTAPGMYEGQRRARWELDTDGQWWFRGYPDREHPTPNQQDRTEFDVLTYGVPLLPSTPKVGEPDAL